jgi:hypothetical protein
VCVSSRNYRTSDCRIGIVVPGVEKGDLFALVVREARVAWRSERNVFKMNQIKKEQNKKRQTLDEINSLLSLENMNLFVD